MPWIHTPPSKARHCEPVTGVTGVAIRSPRVFLNRCAILRRIHAKSPFPVILSEHSESKDLSLLSCTVPVSKRQPPIPATGVAISRKIEEVTSSRPTLSSKQNGHPFGMTVCFGGRYKTRTCDLPHVKRMRYQLRQSSISLDRIHLFFRFVKHFREEKEIFFSLPFLRTWSGPESPLPVQAVNTRRCRRR